MDDELWGKREIRDAINRIMAGEVIVIKDHNTIRHLARALGRERRRRVFIGRDKKNRVTKISLL